MKSTDPHRRISLSRQKAAEMAAANEGWRDGRAGMAYGAADFETDGERRAYDAGYKEARQGQLTIEDNNGN